MDNAKPNERSLHAEGFLPHQRTEWSRRLEEPGALPGVGLTDKEAAWDKLYDRLRETPRRRTLPWLWAAAACLLLALVPAAFLLKEKRNFPHSGGPKVAIRPKAQPKPGQVRTYPPTVAKSSAVPPGTLTPNTRPPGTLAHSSQHAALRHIPDTPAHRSQLTAHSSPPIAAKAPVQNTLPVRNTLPQLILPPRPDLSKPLTAAIPSATPKKQLRVVHINELEPAQPTPSMAGERLKPGRLQVRFTQPETFRPTTSYNNNPTDYPIIPLKHSQNP